LYEQAFGHAHPHVAGADDKCGSRHI